MRNWPKASLILGGALLLACSDKEVNPPDNGGVDAGGGGNACATPLTGTVSRSCTLTADRRWTLQGQVLVPDGVTLTIEPGTTVLGAYGTPVSFLLVDRGGKLIAEGTRDRPIVFTSERAVGDRAPADWGGVVLKGKASLNLPGGEGELEGEAGKYGGGSSPDDDDSSGSLRYVRIEFAGRVISPDNELNSLTFGAVGRGTRIEYVQSHMGTDDTFEWFGGTVDVKHLVASDSDDDGFDVDYGFRGRGQFLVQRQHLADGNNGIEADNNVNNNDLTPFTEPTFYNVTLTSTGRGSNPMKQPRYGMTLRRGTSFHLANVIVTGYAGTGVVMTEDSTAQRVAAGKLELTHSIFWGNGADDTLNLWNAAQASLPKDPANPATTFHIGDWLKQTASANREVDPQLTAPNDATAPDFRPRAGSPALTGAKAPPQDGFFEPAPYVGAFDATTDWTAGWTAYPAN